MALIKSDSLFSTLMILVSLFGASLGGTAHKVGDSKGWTMMDVDYESWAASRTFQVGDSLVFEYNNNFHSVAEVTPNDYVLCDTSKPLANYQTGADTVSLTKPGFYNFICGVPSHCQMGQKVQILVLPASLGPVSAPVPRPLRSRNSSPMAPSPLQSSSSLNKSASWISFSLLVFILAILV